MATRTPRPRRGKGPQTPEPAEKGVTMSRQSVARAHQMIDEVRHSTIQQNLKRLYMQNYIDPAGFNNSLRNFHDDYCGTIGRQFAEGFITGDAITAASIYLTIVAETAFTNTLFVAMPAEAAANGDYLLPTVFHSVQSDESPHI